MASLKFILGIVPQTAKIEQAEAALLKEYDDFQEFSGSKELKRYEELDKLINSGEFAQKKKEIMSRNFKNTDEYKKEQEYIGRKKSKNIRDYYKIKGSHNLEEFNQTESSDDLKKFEKLNAYIGSSEFSEEKQKAGKEYKTTDAFSKEQEYLQLKKSSRLVKYFKFKNSALYQNYTKLDGSKEISEYEELEKFIGSEKFKQVKTYMALSPKKKYEQSDEFKLEEEYNTLKKSEKILWYFRLLKKNDFHTITDWELTFEDNFDSAKLDAKKWMTNYYWGDVLLKDTYALPGDKQFYTNGKNIEIKDSILKIITKKETASGKIWNPVLGFQETEFNYTSGLISTGKSFRQQYGKVVAKIRLKNAPVRQAAWMQADTILPHLDLVKYDRNRINLGSYFGNMSEKGGLKKKLFKTGGGKYTSDFFIYTLEWSPEMIVWKINGMDALSQKDNIPQQSMYIVFSAGITGTISDSQLPSTMEIDYIKVYKRKD